MGVLIQATFPSQPIEASQKFVLPTKKVIYDISTPIFCSL